jgi:hypothetical protein
MAEVRGPTPDLLHKLRRLPSTANPRDRRVGGEQVAEVHAQQRLNDERVTVEGVPIMGTRRE